MNTPPNSKTTTPTIQTFALGDYQTNCFIVTDGDPNPGSPCWIVDCGYQPNTLIDAAQSQQLLVEKIILTHAHADHMAGLFEARSRFPDAKILIHPLEESWLNDPVLNLSAALGLSITGPTPDAYLNHDDTLTLGSITFRIAHTPGHSPGSVSLIHEPSNTAIVGDTLFNGSIGRTDFPGSSFEQLENSIKKYLYTLDPETTCHPGHGPKTKVGHEAVTNPFVRM